MASDVDTPAASVGAQSCCARTGVIAPQAQQDCAPTQGSGFGLWLGVASGFILLLTAWGVLFTAARSAKVEPVPLATKGAKP